MNKNGTPIVAPSLVELAPLRGGQRWPVWLAVALILFAGAGALLRALQEPTTGYRFTVDSLGQVLATATQGDGRDLVDVRAIAGGGLVVPINAQTLTESGGIINLYAEQHRFYAGHRLIWQALHGGEVTLEHAGGSTQVAIAAKPVDALGLRFWFPWFVGLLSLSVGLGVWLYSPQRDAAWCYLLASVGYAFIMLMLAPSGSRLLTQAPEGWQGLHMGSHVAAFLHNGALAYLLWNHPTRMKGRWFLPALLVWSAVWLSVDFMEWVPTISIGFRLPIALFGVMFVALFVLQWRAGRGDPVKRAQLKWLILLFTAGLLVVFFAYVYGASGAPITLPQVYGLGLISLLFLGLVPLVTRLGLFQLEAWWVRAWLWFLGGLTVVALDLVLATVLSVQTQSAWLLATAIGGWVYFPLRQAIWRRISSDARAQTRELLPAIVALASRGSMDDAQAAKDWLALWERAFSPGSIQERSLLQIDAPIVEDQGRRLTVPGGQGLPTLTLTLAERGRRLFGPADAAQATEIVRLVQAGMSSHQSFEHGARQERLRIASDLHDDLGASLLSIAQSSTPGPGAELARQAMEELRLSVRGLSGDASPLADVLADWRAECVSRLMAASIGVNWQASEPDDATDSLLASSLRTQVTRILREAVSNVIRHSEATQCTVELTVQGGTLLIEIGDDGRGMAPARPPDSRGMGLTNMERRARKLGGDFMLHVAAQGGVGLRVSVPLQASANMAP